MTDDAEELKNAPKSMKYFIRDHLNTVEQTLRRIENAVNILTSKTCPVVTASTHSFVNRSDEGNVATLADVMEGKQLESDKERMEKFREIFQGGAQPDLPGIDDGTMTFESEMWGMYNTDKIVLADEMNAKQLAACHADVKEYEERSTKYASGPRDDKLLEIVMGHVTEARAIRKYEKRKAMVSKVHQEMIDRGIKPSGNSAADAVMVMQEVELREAELEMPKEGLAPLSANCPACDGSGYEGHHDEGVLCYECDGMGNGAMELTKSDEADAKPEKVFKSFDQMEAGDAFIGPTELGAHAGKTCTITEDDGGWIAYTIEGDSTWHHLLNRTRYKDFEIVTGTPQTPAARSGSGGDDGVEEEGRRKDLASYQTPTHETSDHDPRTLGAEERTAHDEPEKPSHETQDHDTEDLGAEPHDDGGCKKANCVLAAWHAGRCLMGPS